MPRKTISRADNPDDRVAKLLETLSNPFLLLDSDYCIVRANSPFLEMSGIPERQITGKKIYQLDYYRWDISALHYLLEELIPKQKTVYQYELALLKGASEKITLTCCAQLISDESKTESRYLLIMQDITGYKHATEEQQRLLSLIRAEKKRISEILDSELDEIWVCDSEGRLIAVNEAVSASYDLDPDTFTDFSLKQLTAGIEIHDGTGNRRSIADCPLNRALYGEILKNEEEVIRHPLTNKLMYRLVTSVPLESDDGKTIGAIAVVYDITSSRIIRQEFMQTKTLLENVYSSLDDAVFVVSPVTQKIINCNPATEKMFGYSKDEIIGKSTRMLHVDQNTFNEFGRKAARILETADTYRDGFKLRRKDGTVFSTLHTVKAIRDTAGEVTMLISVVRDTSNLNDLICELDKKEKALTAKSKRLEEMNTTLRILLDQREVEQNHFKGLISDNIKEMILPIVDKLRKTPLSDLQKEYLRVLKRNINQIGGVFKNRRDLKMMLLTPTEIKIADYIKRDLKSAEIANKMNISIRTVEFHRNNIRRKLEIKDRNINLKTFLLSL